MSTTFVRGEDPLKADKLNTAFSERVSRSGDTMQGMLKLASDPVQPFDAATKQYVDRFTAMGVPTGAYIGSSPPGNTLAPLWWDNVSGQLFIQYNDGNSTQWVSANTATLSGASGLYLPLTGGTVTGQTTFSGTGGPPLHISGHAGTFRNMSWETDGVPRFRVGLNNAGETGVSNAGSDLVMSSFADNGSVAVANVLTITRSTGAIAFGGPLNYIATGSTTPRSAQDRAADVLNVKDYGAKLDGVANDTAAFNAARVAAKDGQTILVPRGSLVLSALAVDASKQVRWLLDGATFPGGSDNIVFAPAGCGDIVDSVLTSGTKFLAKRTNPTDASHLMRMDYILDAPGGSNGFIDSALQVNGVINDGVLNAMWAVNIIGDNNASDPSNGGLAVLQVTGRKNSNAIVQTIQATALDTTGLASSANGSRGFSVLEIAQRANNIDDASNGSMWGGFGVRVCQHLNSTVQNATSNVETSFAAGLFISTDATAKTYVKSGIAAALNYQTFQFIDTRGCIPPYVSSNPVAGLRMAHEQVVDFNGGPALNSAPGNYLQYTTTGTPRLRYMAGGNEVWSVDNTGSISGNVTVENFGAKGDGVTDDSAAFNAYATYIRASTAYQPQRTLTLSANRSYKVSSTLNFNSFGLNRVTINGNGSNIIGNVGATKAVISAMASCITFKDLRITAQGSCLYGIQVGIVDATGAGDQPCHMDCVQIIGTFVNACLYNRGAEDSSYVDCKFQTNTAGSYALIMDGCVFWQIDQSTITDTLYTGSTVNISFNAQTFTNGTFINHQSGSAIWMGGGLNRHNYVAGYAQVTDASPLVVYYAPNATMALSGLTWDVHGEILPSCWFFITGPYATPVLEDLVCQDHFNQIAANGFVFKLDTTITSCTLRNFEYRAPLHYQSNVQMFDQPAKYIVTGRVEMPTAAAFNTPSSFNGMLFSGSPQTVGLTVNAPSTVNAALTVTGLTSFTGGSTVVGTGTGGACAHYLVSAVGNVRTINWFTGNTGTAGQRWNMGANSVAEGGANAGSDFAIAAYSDTGTLLGVPLSIVRATQQTLINSLRVTGTIGFNNTAPIVKPTVSGAKGSNAALASLLTALANYGLITDSSTA